MVTLKIDRKTIQVKAGTTILEAARKAGFRIPTLCYLEGINEIGACRVCVVELKGAEQLVTACNTAVQEGMEVLTSSPRVRHARRAAVELMLTEHDCNCPTCVRNGNCKLQTLANSLGVRNVRLKNRIPTQRVDDSSPSIVRDPKKCVMCYRCVSFCDKVQSLGVWRISGTGARTSIEPAFGKPLATTDCAYCGQCVTHCPVGALYEKSDKDKVWDLLSDPEKVTIVQVAPAVRASWGEELGISREVATPERLVATLRHLGFDHIFDTCFTADLTIMEEGTELLGRIGSKDAKMPMFTSCCPGWVRFVKTQYPELVEHLSSAKSPQQMFGAVAKTYYADILGIPAEKMTVISIMPCTAKKYEAGVSVLADAGTERDVDIVLTTREMCAMIREEGVEVAALEEEPFDSPLGVSTGAGVIFGATGGVMEAALRTAAFIVNGENPDPDSFGQVRGMDGWKELTVNLKGSTVKCAVVNGLGNTRRLIEAMKQGRVKYDFIEVMACPGGCAAGGGQPISVDDEVRTEERSDNLYNLDSKAPLRFSHENPAITDIYENFLGSPCSEKSHHLLHTDQRTWELSSAAEREPLKKRASD
jgi:NADH-quinone oxidoreductase subunit G